MLRFTSPIPPSSNEYLGKRIAYSGRHAYVQVYKTKKAMDYEKYMVKTLVRNAKEQGWIIPEKNDYLEMELVYYMNKLGRDIDNTYKLLIDALANAGLIINDDKVIPIPKNIYIDKDNPRIEVLLKVSEKRGVFDNQKQADEFIAKNCSNCSRYKKNCSLLKKAYENRIQQEVDLEKMLCSKRRGNKNEKENFK